MSVRVDILRSLLNFVNASGLTQGLLVKFDDLDLKTDSFCFTIPLDDDPAEHLDDVSGTYLAGKMVVELYYRVVSKVRGRDSLDSMDILSDIVEKILSDFKYDENEGYVSGIRWIAAPRFHRVYQGKIKDFVTKIEISYERST